MGDNIKVTGREIEESICRAQNGANWRSVLKPSSTINTEGILLAEQLSVSRVIF